MKCKVKGKFEVEVEYIINTDDSDEALERAENEVRITSYPHQFQPSIGVESSSFHDKPTFEADSDITWDEEPEEIIE